MVPAVTVQLTMVLKAPVPNTVALHWINWLDWMAWGRQLATMPVTVVGLLLEPQPASHKTAPTTDKSPNLLIIRVTIAFSHTELAQQGVRLANSIRGKLFPPVGIKGGLFFSRSHYSPEDGALTAISRRGRTVRRGKRSRCRPVSPSDG